MMFSVRSSDVTANETSAKWFSVSGTPVSVAFWTVMPFARLYSSAVKVVGFRTVMVEAAG